jgi:superfamily II DNA or RNA helicase
VLPPLRPYQESALERASELSSEHRSILIVSPTGTGKTRLFVEACCRHVQKGGVPLVIAPRRELISQAVAQLRSAGLEEGHDVFVRTIQELVTTRAEIPPATMIVFDEARHYLADEWSKVRAALPDAFCLGADATPERGDGRGLSGMFDVLLEAITIKDAVAGGFLVPCETLRPEHALGPGELAQHPVDAYLEKANGTSAIIFAPSVALALEWGAMLRDRGVHAAGVHGEMPIGERDACIDAYNSGELKVLVNVALLTEGFDAPHTETVILAGPCGTAGGMLQRAGRGMRLAPGKTRMLLIDLKGITHTFGDVDEERSWHLEGKAARRAADDIELRFCPVCGAPTQTVACEQCGYSGELKKRKPRVLGLPIDRFAREHAMSDERAAKELRGLYGVAQRKGYRPFWAERVWSHRYGRPVTAEIRRLTRSG